MSDYSGRYFGPKDSNFINSINAEYFGDISQVFVVCFKIAADTTNTNIYGESKGTDGKSYYDGIELTTLIRHNDINSEDEGYGPDRDQTIDFKFRYRSLADAGYYPQNGDLVFYNERYYEISNVVVEQRLGNQPTKDHSIICHGVYTRLTNINIVDAPQ